MTDVTKRSWCCSAYPNHTDICVNAIAPNVAAAMAEPVATLPACLCGLDTNPVASPRMDIHCPKHDAPELGGGPELPCAPCPWCSAPADAKDEWGYLITHKSKCYWTNIHGDPIGRVRVNFSEVAQWNTRVSQPADWLKDNEIKRLTDERNQLAQQGAELWERANTVQPVGEPDEWAYMSDDDAARVREADQRRWEAAQPSPTPADEEVARAVVGTVFHNTDASLETLERTMMERITTALAEARRQGEEGKGDG